MSVTYEQAYAELANAVATVWANGPALINQPKITMPIILANKEPDTPYSADQYYGRFIALDSRSPQTTFATNQGGVDTRRFRTYGNAYMQIFTPQAEPTSEADSQALAGMVQAALRQSTPNVTVSNVRIKLLPSDTNYYRRNVVADYNYDEIV